MSFGRHPRRRCDEDVRNRPNFFRCRSNAASGRSAGNRDDRRLAARLRGDGRLVIPAELPEGAGDGAGERRFHRRLCEADDPETLYREMREGYEPGAQRAFVAARVLRECDLSVTNSDVLVPDALNTLLVPE